MRAKDGAALVGAACAAWAGVAADVARAAAALRAAERVAGVADRVAKGRGTLGLADAYSTAAIAVAEGIATATTEPVAGHLAFGLVREG